MIESHHWLTKKSGLTKLRVVDRSFQWKYTLYLLSAVVGTALLFLGPASYFLLQNYKIFVSLGYKTEPALVEHLERETIWLGVFFGVGLVALIGLCISIGLKLTESLVGPLISMERHMKKIAAGDWTREDFRIRSTDDYRKLAETYNYMYKSLKAQAGQDLRWLEKIVIDPKNREALAAWEALVKTRSSQLGIKNKLTQPNLELTGPAASPDAALPKRLVS